MHLEGGGAAARSDDSRLVAFVLGEVGAVMSVMRSAVRGARGPARSGRSPPLQLLHVNDHRLGEQRSSGAREAFGHRRREEQRLRGRAHVGTRVQGGHLLGEPRREQELVRLVQDDVTHGAQVDAAAAAAVGGSLLAGEVEKTARRRDEHVEGRSHLEGRQLRVARLTAVDRRHAPSRRLVRARPQHGRAHVSHLLRELARWHEDESARRTECAVIWPTAEELNQRQRIAQRLAAARRRAADHV